MSDYFNINLGKTPNTWTTMDGSSSAGKQE